MRIPDSLDERQPGGRPGIGLGQPGGLRDVLVRVGSDSWDSRVPRRPPGWRSVVWALVAEIIAGSASSK